MESDPCIRCCFFGHRLKHTEKEIRVTCSGCPSSAARFPDAHPRRVCFLFSGIFLSCGRLRKLWGCSGSIVSESSHPDRTCRGLFLCPDTETFSREEACTMQRLSYLLHNMDRCEEHYYALYGGPIEVITNGDLSYSDEDPLYWQDDISYQIDQSGRSHDDRPDILVRIPVRRLLRNRADKGETALKRLKWYFTRMENDTETYSWREGTKREELYNARISVEIPGHDFPEENSDNTYWSGKTSFVLEKGGRDQNDLPTVTAQIPVAVLRHLLYRHWRRRRNGKTRGRRTYTIFCARRRIIACGRSHRILTAATRHTTTVRDRTRKTANSSSTDRMQRFSPATRRFLRNVRHGSTNISAAVR